MRRPLHGFCTFAVSHAIEDMVFAVMFTRFMFAVKRIEGMQVEDIRYASEKH